MIEYSILVPTRARPSNMKRLCNSVFSTASNPESVEVIFYIDDDDFKAQIRDYGKQCDSSQIKPRCLDQIKSGGLGTHLINEFMDEISYCTERGKATLLTMVKK